MGKENTMYMVDYESKKYDADAIKNTPVVDWVKHVNQENKKIVQQYRKNYNYVYNVPLSEKIQQCKNITDEYKKKAARELNFYKLKELRKQLIHDFLEASPDLDWFSTYTYLFKAIFPNLETSPVLRTSKWISVRNECLAEFAKAYEANVFDNHVFNKVIKLFGQGYEVLKENLSQEKFDLAMKENINVIPYFDSVLVNRIIMIRHIAYNVDDISRTNAYAGREFVKDVESFAGNYLTKHLNNPKYFSKVFEQVLDVMLKKTPLPAFSLNEKYVGEKIIKNITHVDAVEVTNTPGKHMFLKLKYENENYVEETNEQQKDGENAVPEKLSIAELQDNLPEGVSLHHVLADKCYLTIDGFDIMPEMLQDNIDECNKAAAAQETNHMFGK